ncbi:MAG: universal stress protein [Proteobacteria bacterium]|nr:universal stress protein [Pseudomonadota bacterium]
MKILLAVDGSEYTRRMLDYLATHKDDLGAARNTYTVFHAVLPVPSHAASFVNASTLHGYYEDQAREVLDPIRALLAQSGIEASFAHRAGPADKEIAELARAGGFDLVAMGSHGQGALSNLVLGSVATKVLANCQVPVLLVR